MIAGYLRMWIWYAFWMECVGDSYCKGCRVGKSSKTSAEGVYFCEASSHQLCLLFRLFWLLIKKLEAFCYLIWSFAAVYSFNFQLTFSGLISLVQLGFFCCVHIWIFWLVILKLINWSLLCSYFVWMESVFIRFRVTQHRRCEKWLRSLGYFVTMFGSGSWVSCQCLTACIFSFVSALSCVLFL